MPTATSDVPIPADTRAEIARKKRPAEYVVPGRLLNVGAAIDECEPLTADQRALSAHVARWSRFYARWHGRQHTVAYLATTMHLWECRKAAISIDDAEQRHWFVRLSPMNRMMLVKEEQERRASERRFLLAKRALRKIT